MYKGERVWARKGLLSVKAVQRIATEIVLPRSGSLWAAFAELIRGLGSFSLTALGHSGYDGGLLLPATHFGCGLLDT